MMRRPVLNSSGSPKPKVDCILDSGAFSAWKLGKPVIIDEYCDYLHANMDWMGHYVNLDVINPKDPEAAAAASFENLLHMRKRGLNPVPVYHVGEDISWLFRMLDLGCSYIGLSASSLVSRNQVDDWYALAWSHLTTSSGDPIVKAHAFGEGRLSSMLKFPWYSADSTSWIYDAQRNGAMTMPGGSKIVQRNDGAHKKQAQDIEQLEGEEGESFKAMLRGMGIDPLGFADRGSRTATILRTYVAMVDCMHKQARTRAAQPIKFSRPGLFYNGVAHPDTRAVPPTPFKFHLVMGSNPIATAILAYAGYENTLASYFYVKTLSFYNQLRAYCNDPAGVSKSMKPYASTWAVLEKFVNVPAPV